MKTCQECNGLAVADDAATCHACGGASWGTISRVQLPAAFYDATSGALTGDPVQAVRDAVASLTPPADPAIESGDDHASVSAISPLSRREQRRQNR